MLAENAAEISRAVGIRWPKVALGGSAKCDEGEVNGMRVISQSPDPLARMHTMTDRKRESGTIDVKALLAGDEEFPRALVRTASRRCSKRR
jgi:hypothetical protein